MLNADETIKWILVIDLVIMSFYLIKSVREFEKQQKDEK
jgi:hypothetical protein